MLDMLLIPLEKVLTNPIYIFAMALAALGIACALLAKKITRLVRKTQEVSPDDKILLYIKVAGLAGILAGCILLVIGAVV